MGDQTFCQSLSLRRESRLNQSRERLRNAMFWLSGSSCRFQRRRPRTRRLSPFVPWLPRSWWSAYGGVECRGTWSAGSRRFSICRTGERDRARWIEAFASALGSGGTSGRWEAAIQQPWPEPRRSEVAVHRRSHRPDATPIAESKYPNWWFSPGAPITRTTLVSCPALTSIRTLCCSKFPSFSRLHVYTTERQHSHTLTIG